MMTAAKAGHAGCQRGVVGVGALLALVVRERDCMRMLLSPLATPMLMMALHRGRDIDRRLR